MPEAREYEVHMISFKRKGVNAYYTQHKHEVLHPWQVELLMKFIEDRALSGAEDLA